MTKSQTPIDGSKSPIVTFIPSEYREVDLEARGFTTGLAAELRQRLLTFEEDWNAQGWKPMIGSLPEMQPVNEALRVTLGL